MTPEERLAKLEALLEDAKWLARMIGPTQLGKEKLTSINILDAQDGRLAAFKAKVEELSNENQ